MILPIKLLKLTQEGLWRLLDINYKYKIFTSYLVISVIFFVFF